MSELTFETRQKLKSSSKSLLRLHKILLDYERAVYEKANGEVKTPNELFGLVLDHPHFAWLRVISGQIVVIDEFLASKTQVIEIDGHELIVQTRQLLSFEIEHENFADRFQGALLNSSDAVVGYNEVLKLLND